jgi:acetate kinase
MKPANPRVLRLEFLGIELEEKRNAVNEAVISADAGRVAVRVIHTDEERMIAETVCRVLGLQGGYEICHEDEED